MTTKKAVRHAPEDRMVGLTEGCTRLGYAPAYMRQVLARGEEGRPPFRKVRGQWKAWVSELDAWLDAEQSA